MRKDKMKNVYTTLDAYLSGYLSLKGHPPTLTWQADTRKVIFVFPSSQELQNVISDYNKGATVEAYRFALVIKNLKSQIFALKTRRAFQT